MKTEYMQWLAQITLKSHVKIKLSRAAAIIYQQSTKSYLPKVNKQNEWIFISTIIVEKNTDEILE